MYTELEELFDTYWNKDIRNTHYSGAFLNLKRHAKNIILNDPEMNWMDDKKAATIIHHVIYVEGGQIVDSGSSELSEWRNTPIRIDRAEDEHNEAAEIISPCTTEAITLFPEESHSLTSDYIKIKTLGIQIVSQYEDEEKIIQDAYPAIERFLEQERRLFNREVSLYAISRMKNVWKKVVSPHVGQWIYYDKNNMERAGTLQEVCNEILFD